MLIEFQWIVDDVAVDADSVVLSNAAGTFGVKNSDTDEVVVAAGTAMTHDGVGLYSYDLDAEGDFEYWVKVTYEFSTFYVQGFKSSATQTRTIRAVFLDETGLGLELASLPQLSAPSGGYGLKALNAGTTILAAGTAMAAASAAGHYTKGFTPLESEHERYRFYVKAAINDEILYLPSVTTKVSYSVAYCAGRYTDSYAVGQLFGHDNIALWCGTPQYGTQETDEPADFALRLSKFILDAENRLDAELYGAHVTGPFEADSDTIIPPLISQLAAKLAGIAMYESRGVDDVTGEGEPTHRLSALKKRVANDIRRIRLGLLTVKPVLGYTPVVGAINPKRRD